jgi:hydroxyacylglutathione hydrolase
MPQVYADANVTIELVGPLGPQANNAYIVRPAGGWPAVVIDAPAGSEAVVEALGTTAVRAIVVTHSHRDHWDGFATLRERTLAHAYAGELGSGEGAPVVPTSTERAAPAEVVVAMLAHGAQVPVGRTALRVIHTPGHTPGSICLLVGGALLTGDTLFPGGPGHSRTPEALAEEIASITALLYTLPDETLVLPGHGAGTTIGASKAEYAVFASKPHPADLCGDVNWAQS